MAAWARLGIAIACLAAGLGCAPQKPTCALPVPEAAELRRQLGDRRFDELERTLRAYQDATDEDPACESRTWTAFQIHAGDLREHRALLDAFVAAFPESFVPYAVRGDWWVRVGLDFRGGKAIRDVDARRLREMHAAFDQAAADLARARELRPDASFPYGRLILIGKIGGTSEDVYAAFGEGVGVAPRSHNLYETMVFAREPRWGGTRSEQARIALAAWARSDENPRMMEAVGDLFASFGDAEWRRGRRELALFYYDLSLRLDDSLELYERRIKARSKLGDGEGTIADARAILAKEPKHELAWGYLIGTLNRRGDWKSSVREADAGLVAIPESISILEYRAYARSRAGQMELAEADYLHLMEIAPGSEHSQAYSRFLVDVKRSDYDRAIQVMQEAVAHDPNDAENWSHLAAAQYMIHDPALRASYQKFVELVDTSVPENAQRKREIQAFLDSGAGARDRGGRIPPEEAARLREAAR